MKKFKLKKLLCIIVIFISALVLGTVSSNAASLSQLPGLGAKAVKKTVSIGRLQGVHNLYCVQQPKHHQGGTFTIFKYVKIEGNTATNNKGKSVTSSENAKLAYILGGGGSGYGSGEGYAPNYSKRQSALWRYMDTWMSRVGKHLGVNWTVGNPSRPHNPGDLLTKANNAGPTATASISNTGTSKLRINNNVIGPFRVQYTGSITSVQIKDTNGNAISSGIKFYSNSNATREIKASEIRSNTNFYIKNTSRKTPKEMTINVQSSGVGDTEIWFLKNPKVVTTAQRLLYVHSTPKTTRASVTIPIDVDINLKGYVWVNSPVTKANQVDGSLYQAGMKLLPGVTVNLKRKSDGATIASAITDGNGAYIFEKKVTMLTVGNYYVEFNYKSTQGGTYKEYIPVAFNAVANGSKALEDEIKPWVQDNKAIASTYKGTDATKEATYGLTKLMNSGLFDQNAATLSNINLGIKTIPQVDYTMSQDIDYVTVTINGYTYRYNYGTKGNTKLKAAPTVSWQSKNSIAAYTRAIYPSDILYKPEDARKRLEIYVTYRTDITNTTEIGTGDTAERMKELYQERTLHVTKLQNAFDTNRYELSDKNWTANNGTATITDAYIKDIKETGIKPGANNTATKYITFKVRRDKDKDAVMEILDHPYGIIEQFPVKSIIPDNGAYHKFERYDYAWNYPNIKSADIQTHYVYDKKDEKQAPYLILKLGTARTISGYVFEDKIKKNEISGEVLGNGVYDNGEKLISGVKVELLSGKYDKEPTGLYKVTLSADGTKVESKEIAVSATTETGTDGKFKLEGVVPGDYYLRFIYGNGQYKVIDANGKEVFAGTLVKDSKLNNQTIISAKEYKSTIVTSESAKNGIENESNIADTQHNWYKSLNADNYSVAIDNLNTRVEVNKKDESNTLNGIDALTAKISITVENTPTNIANETDASQTSQTSVHENKFVGFNLGVITQPIESARIDKVISNMKLVNAQGNLIFEGNPESTQMQGVSDLDNTKNGGSVFTRAEVDEEQMYGSTLTITYLITVTNTSDTNYYERKYYVYGEKTGAHEVTLTVKEVTDYLDPTLAYLGVSEGKTVTEVTETATAQSAEATARETKDLKITGWEVLYTENNKERAQAKQNDVKTSDSASIATQKILSTQDNDMEFINEAQITDARPLPESNKYDSRTDAIKNAEVSTTKQVVKVNEAPAKATIIITPPTGADLKTILIYTGVTALALAVLSAGVIIIKKKIL